MSKAASPLVATSRLTIDLGAIVRNWKLLGSFAPNAATGAAVRQMPMAWGLNR
ncbi:MAG: hypothetical protein R3D29_01220 [Nitratireductor sp.]